jgi:hypothetical protein
MTSTDRPDPYAATPPSSTYPPPQHPPPPYGAATPGPWAAQPHAARRGSPVVAVLLTVGATLLAPVGYLLLARGATDRYRLTAMMMQTGSELVVPTLLLLLGVALLGAVALAGGWAPSAPLVPGALFGLAGLHGLVDPVGAFRVPVDLLGYQTGNALGTLATMSVPLLVSVLLVAAGVAGALGRRRGRQGR